MAHPLTGDIVLKYDDDSIKRAIKQLVMLNSYEKPFHPNIAGSIRELLFEPMTINTSISIESRVEFLITQYEPRADLIKITVEPDYGKNQYEVTIMFKIKNQLNPIEQKIFLQRIR